MSDLFFSFQIPGKPQPAVRMTQKSKFKNVYAQRYLVYKQLVGTIAKEAMHKANIWEPLEGNIFISINIHLMKPDKRRWDIDNVVKSILDGCNHIAWQDDKQVIGITAIVLPQESEEDYIRVGITNSYTE